MNYLQFLSLSINLDTVCYFNINKSDDYSEENQIVNVIISYTNNQQSSFSINLNNNLQRMALLKLISLAHDLSISKAEKMLETMLNQILKLNFDTIYK